MTVSSTSRKAGPFSGNGSTTSYPFLFKVFTKNDVQVVRADPYGVETTLTLDSDYSVAVNADQTASPGGTITYPISGSPLPVGYTLAVIGALAYNQGTSLPTGGAFNAANVEAALDRLTILNQQLLEKVSRAALVPVTNTADATVLVADILLLANNIAALQAIVANAANINAAVANAANINTVAGNNTNVTNVGGSIASVNTVAGSIANVIAVAANAANINTAATNIVSIQNASGNATSAASSAASASASAAAAAAVIASGMYSAVQDKTGNYTVVAADAGDLLRINTSGGAATITLPAISTVTDGYKVAIVKWTGDVNAATVQRSASDLINGSSSYVLDAQYKSATFVADAETSTWFAAGTGGGGANVVVDPFTGNGVATTLTLSGDPGSKNNTDVFIGTVHQDHASYTLSAGVITLSAAPANGVSIEVVWTQPLAIGVPGDATVTAAKMAPGAALGNLGFTPVSNAGAETIAGVKTFSSMPQATAGIGFMASGWTIVETAGVLYFKYNGVNKAKIDGSGNIVAAANITAYGTV